MTCQFINLKSCQVLRKWHSLWHLVLMGLLRRLMDNFCQVSCLIAWILRLTSMRHSLPKYRGGAPIHYAIINGDAEAGVTIMEMVKEMDAGDMVSQKALPILDEDNVGTMFEKLAVLGRDLLLETLPAYIAGEIKPVPQDASQVTFSPNISPEEERLDWNKSARDIFNQIRGMYPWPVAHTLLDGKRFKIYEADLAEGQGQAGHIIEKPRRVW